MQYVTNMRYIPRPHITDCLHSLAESEVIIITNQRDKNAKWSHVF